MVSEIVIAIVSTIGSAFFSWLFTHRYYLKNLKNQRVEFENDNRALLTELNKLSTTQKLSADIDKLLLRDKRIEDAFIEYRKKGTPKLLIDTYNLNNAEKADLYDTVILRAKGRKPKNNPYRL